MSRVFDTGRLRAPPVRRGSELANSSRWTRFSREEGNRLLFALKVKAERLRKPGQRTGAPGTLSFGAIRLAEVFVSLCVKGNGRLEPSVAWLAKAVNVPKKTIHAWKRQLQEQGFLRWTRRYLRVGAPGQKGPQLRQTSNAYSLMIPAAAATYADRLRCPQFRVAERIVSPDLQAALEKLEWAVGDEQAQAAQRESPKGAEPRLT